MIDLHTPAKATDARTHGRNYLRSIDQLGVNRTSDNEVSISIEDDSENGHVELILTPAQARALVTSLRHAGIR